ncbi:hypothetical protein RZS08_25140, partial [Arthrospira platensis SPKY1]|nr:hypothetical protein [Arthrospira platensis SPKY1]
ATLFQVQTQCQKILQQLTYLYKFYLFSSLKRLFKDNDFFNVSLLSLAITFRRLAQAGILKHKSIK